MTLEELTPSAAVRGIVPDSTVTVVSVHWYGSSAVELTYKTATGKVANTLLFREDEPRLEIVETGRPWSFDGDGALFRLVAEAQRIHLAHLFDPMLAVHTSQVDPLPHQITAVYEAMLPRQPLRFLLADDPGAGKTIMAGLLIKELMARGDVQRCLIVCPGSLAEQWQDELYHRFGLPFEIMTNDKLESAKIGNWFVENHLVIARLDKLARNPALQEKLQAPEADWDLVVCDEAHKMSASFFGGEATYTQRYHLGQVLSQVTRHFLLMSATPHNGKEEDFQLFLALLDGDRFEGKFRDGAHTSDISDLMRRMVKEDLLRFDGTPLFPERRAYTVPYKLSDAEARLYREVSDYVREEFSRAEALSDGESAKTTIGFALTILQRRLASSPEAIYQSLRRRRERLESRLREAELMQRGAQVQLELPVDTPLLDAEAVEDLEEATDAEAASTEEKILFQATAARTIQEYQAEIRTLTRLEGLALEVRRGGRDTKWTELSDLLNQIFTPAAFPRVAEDSAPYDGEDPSLMKPSPSQKLVIFTEHRDTLAYLHDRIETRLGRPEAIVTIHGGTPREERRTVEERFRNDPTVQILLATDAAGEGINLQKAHLMVNYDLPWNPNRLEQRFGRIHRIGQTEVCHLWNMVADDTREGDVYRRLLEKLEQARKSLGGQVFDVLGALQFQGQSLRQLLVEAVRYGDQDDVRARLTTVVDAALDREQLRQLIGDNALVQDVMDARKVMAIREEMERADARRLQPHYIASFFEEAFRQLGGNLRAREPRRYEITNVPAQIRNRNRLWGRGTPVISRYERITFEKELAPSPGSGLPSAEFICPGHPLLDAVIDLTLERHRDLLRQGTVLVDERDDSLTPRVLFTLDHAIQDATVTRTGAQREISRQLLYVEQREDGSTRHIHYAPYLDYRPLADDEPDIASVLARPECAWVDRSLEQQALGYAVANVVPQHVREVREPRLELIAKTRAAVKERLTKEITHWDHRAHDLKQQERAGKVNARLNSGEALRRAETLHARLGKRMADLALEEQISPLPPVVLGAVLVVPIGLLRAMQGKPPLLRPVVDTQAAAAEARATVMRIERELGFDPIDREFERLGYDIESRNPHTGELRFIEVKGRASDANTITVTRNEVLYSLNNPEKYILAIVEFSPTGHNVHYVRSPFHREPDFGVTSLNYDLNNLRAKAEAPR